MKLYFMDREFPAHCWHLYESMVEGELIDSLVFEDSYYFLRYHFFSRDSLHSETANTLQTQLYNLLAGLYRHYEQIDCEEYPLKDIIEELLQVIDYAAQFPVSLWVFGDETSREYLDGWMEQLPSTKQMAFVQNLPHISRHELDRHPYRYSEPKPALKRYRNELANYNRRIKLAAKNKQREQNQNP